MLINPKYEHLREWLERLPEEFERLGEIIYDKRNQLRVIEAPDGTLVNVKRYCVPHALNRVVYSLGIRQPKGKRAFLYPARLLERGIDTPEPIAYIERRRCGLLGLSYFVSVQSPLGHTLYELSNAQKGTYEDLAEAVGRFVAIMHEREVLHLDLSPGNILWDKDEQGYHFAVVDINRMHFGKVSLEQGCATLCRLWGPKRLTELVARSYARGRGVDEEQAVTLTMQARTAYWTRYLHRGHTIDFPLEL
jgi:hypothetical protein